MFSQDRQNKVPSVVRLWVLLFVLSLLIWAYRNIFESSQVSSIEIWNMLIGIESTIFTWLLHFFLWASYLLFIFLFYKIYLWKKWARAAFLILFLAWMFSNLGTMIQYSLDAPAFLILLLWEYVLSIAWLYLIFKKSATQYFHEQNKVKKESKIKKHKKKILIFIAFILLLSGIIYFFMTVNPEEMVEKIGVENGYILALFTSFFAGFSMVTTASAYSFLAALIAGGLNPLILGLIGWLSLSLWDMTMYYLWRKGRDLVTGRFNKEIQYVSDTLEKRNLERFIPIISYIYIAFTPLPNDMLLIFLATIKFSPKKTALIIILWDFTLMLAFTLVIAQWISLFS